jgi:von Hippel-Lindau disease tumor supressor
MRTLRVGLLLCIFTATVALAQETNLTITIDGVTYENYHWGTITPTTVSIIHRTGVATIPLQRLPQDLQQRFGYDPKKVAEQHRVPEQKAAVAASGNQKHPAEMAGISSVSPISVTAWIVFVNESKDLRKIYWLDYKGGRQRWGELKPGEKVEQQTYLGHAWLVTDAEDNALGLYYPDGQKRVVVLQ